ncbi:EF-hand domain-containing family member C2 [Eumeta japonica]|uniref:EF-hand domain-containing family member C2 n=1 Tax=Eumeta variegata TaxID=151549 RepID=A0A4C1YQ48_EUMVA|nr:EF-hand domain-containing family member C2 [Eumeta japonica]
MIAVTEYYSPCDLIVGSTVSVYGRRFLICDCDAYTRHYFKSIFLWSGFQADIARILSKAPTTRRPSSLTKYESMFLICQEKKKCDIQTDSNRNLDVRGPLRHFTYGPFIQYNFKAGTDNISSARSVWHPIKENISVSSTTKIEKLPTTDRTRKAPSNAS